MTINDGRLRMTLRDYFAGQALALIPLRPAEIAAAEAYKVADAMLEARKKLPES